MKIDDEDYRNIIYAEDGILVNNKMYFVARDIPIIYMIDANTGKSEFVSNLFKDSISLKQSSRKIVRWENELVIIPYNSAYIYIYNFITNKIDCINNKWSEYGYMYIEAFEYNDKIYMIGAFQKNILELDMKTKNLTVRNTYFEKFINANELFCRSGYVVDSDIMYIALAVSNEILKIDMKTWDYSIIKAKGIEGGFSGIAYDGKSFWLSARRGNSIINWDGNERWEQINLPFYGDAKTCNYGGIYYYDNKIWLHGFEGEYSATIDKSIKQVDSYQKRNYIFFRNVNGSGIVGQDWDGNIHLFRGNEDKVFKYEVNNEMFGKIKKSFNEKQIFGKNGFALENANFQLDDFLARIF